MRYIHYFFAALMLVVIISSPAPAHEEFRAGDLVITEPRAAATLAGTSNGSVHFSIGNKGAQADRLVAANAAVAEKTSLHTHTMENGVMKMREIDGIDIPPGATVELKSGGLHVMLIGLKAPLKEGDSFPMTMTFQKAGQATVQVLVSGNAAKHSEHHDHMDHMGSPDHKDHDGGPAH